MVVGNTHYSVATVLTTFMSGLALGSYIGGRFIDKRNNPLTIYALLEAAIGIYCFLIPYLIGVTSPLFKWIYLNYQNAYVEASFFRFLVCGGILFLPTLFMGATLPILSKFTSNDSSLIGKDVGILYGINTFGAVVGALTGAFVFMRLWGLHATIQAAAILNLVIAIGVFIMFREHRIVSPSRTEPDQQLQDGQAMIVLLCFGFSGLSAMVYQVAWNRIFSLLLGSSVYAFSLILTIFILGLALGTLFFSRFCNSFSDLIKVFGVLQVVIGISALLALPLFGEIPFVNRWVYKNWGFGFASIQMANFLIIFSLLFVPTFFMGAQFPIVVKIVARRLSTVGSHVGNAYSSNTVGAISGSFLGGFVLIPWLGVQNTILCAVFLNVVLGFLLLFLSKNLSTNIKVYVLPMILILCVMGARELPAWDKAVISSGSFMPYRLADLDLAVDKKTKILFYKEGLHTTVTTELAVSGNIFLRVNGKTDASLALDMRTQLLSGYLPMLLHENPKTALVIGQGSGITLGAVEQFPVKQIDLVEISETVIEGSRYFSPFSHNALDDKRLNLILEDGRNHIALTDKTYDVIISEPSNPWISGVGALFTRDFFTMARKRLNPGGILCIWVHTNMSPENFKSVTKTFSTVFPFVTMWESIVGDDYLLIGSNEGYKLPYESVTRFLADEAKGKDLRDIGIYNVRDLMSLMIMNRENLLRFSGDAPIHTDDNALLEFSAPEYIYKDERDILVRQINPFAKMDPGILWFDTLAGPAQNHALNNILDAKRSESQIAEIKRKARIDQLLDLALESFQQQQYENARLHYQEILSLDPDHVLTYFNLGNLYMALQQYSDAEASYKKTIAINPYYLFGYVALAKLYLSTDQAAKAEALLRQVLIWQPADKELHLYLGLAYSRQRDAAQAVGEWNKALELDRRYALAHYYLGVQYQNGNPSVAKHHLQAFLNMAQRETHDNGLIVSAENILKKL